VPHPRRFPASPAISPPVLPAVVATLLATLLFGAGCHDLFDGVLPYVCPTEDAAASARLPARLGATGLYQDVARRTLAPGVIRYRPRFELWSDGASKERWLWLPAGARIDTRDPDDWIFPEGTRVWKEFSRAGVPLETRLLAKLGPGEDAWVAQAYLWTDDGAEALAAPAGHVDARGTPHDVPAAGECVACHGGRRSFVLGVSAIQLASPAGPGLVDLSQLEAAGWLSQPLPRPLDPPGGEAARAALGYLHANCGHCHNAARPPAKPCFAPDNALDFWLRVDRLGSVEATPAATSAIGGPIRPGDPDGSPLLEVVGTLDAFARMPPLATRLIDTQALALLRRWISELP
jgi:hypothetical protein